MGSWLSCKKFCECASRKLDNAVRWYQLPGYYFHYLICLTCRRYLEQITLIDSALRPSVASETEDEVDQNQQALGEDGKQRIASSIVGKAVNPN